MSGFVAANGQILDPNGNPFIAKGINIYDNQMLAGPELTTLFPGMNMVRLAVEDLSTPLSDIQTFVQQMTSQGIVVEIEDHTSPGGVDNIPTGSALTNELNWYSQLASTFANNPYVWFGTMNEPYSPSDETQVSAQEKQIYDTIRAAGNTNPVMLEQIGGFTDTGLAASDYSAMTNVIWDTHYYGWVSNMSTDQTTVDNALTAQVANAQSISSAEGQIPVIIGEYGPSSDGTTTDANASQVEQAVQSSGYGSLAWEFGAGADDLVQGSFPTGGTLTSYGQEVANFIATPTTAPPPPPPPSPIPTITTGTGSDTLSLNISEDAWANGDSISDPNGDATFTVSVDGQQLGGTFTDLASHSAGQTETFVFNGDWTPGAHTVTVDFLNDAWGGTSTTDRNLYVDSVTYDGTNTNQSAVMGSDGPVNFTVTDNTAIPVVAPPPPPAGPSDAIVLNISEDAWANGDNISDANGDATFTVSVDGTQLGGTYTATASHSAGQDQAFTFTGDWGVGPHTVTVDFTNDAWDGVGVNDRNLYVDSVTYDGTNTNQSAPLYSNGPVNFTVNDTTPVPTVSQTQTVTLSTPSPTVNVSDANITGTGTFSLFIGGTHDAAVLTGGAETVQAYQGYNAITTAGYNDTIKFGGFNNVISAGSGSNVLYDSGSDNTIVIPVAGKDTVYGSVFQNNDVLDLSQILKAAGWDGQQSTLTNYLKEGNNSGNAELFSRTSTSAKFHLSAVFEQSGNMTLQQMLAHSIT